MFPNYSSRKDETDPLLSLLQQKGFVHENEHMVSFKEQGLSIIKIDKGWEFLMNLDNFEYLDCSITAHAIFSIHA